MATIGFEEELWASADKLRNNMDAAEYKHVVSRSIRINIFKIYKKCEICIAHTFYIFNSAIIFSKGEFL